MESLFEYYRMKANENDEVIFQRVKKEDITICGKSIDEVIYILNGLEIERQTDIKMTMENLSYLIKKICEEDNRKLRESFNGNNIKRN